MLRHHARQFPIGRGAHARRWSKFFGDRVDVIGEASRPAIRFMRLRPIQPRFRAGYRRLAAVRADTILLRLQNGYDVAWYISRASSPTPTR